MSALGGKADGLIRLRDEFRVSVPDFVVAPFAELFIGFDGARREIADAYARFVAGGTETGLELRLARIAEALTLDTEALDRLHSKIINAGLSTVSFRTSALLEDGIDASFAGQYDTFLDVDYGRGELDEHARRCAMSMISLRVMRYARERRIHRFDVGGSLIVQQMFHGDAAGVLFTENGTGAMSIASSSLSANAVVEGGDAQEYILPRGANVDSTIPKPIRRLAEITWRLEAAVGHPLDLEWAYRSNQVMILQMRPLTVQPLSVEWEWDSTNISENYPGVTLPLTYSVIRELYAGVYMSFVRMLGATEKRIRAEEHNFRNMLGYINGRVYYRITNWYTLLKFLPGRANQEFFEAMLNPVRHRGKSKRRRRMDVPSLVALSRFLWMLARSESRSTRFRDNFAAKLEFYRGYRVDFVSAPALLAASTTIRREILADWSAPILNDVKLMVFHGMLTRFFFRAEDSTEYLEFLRGLTDRASLTPLEHLAKVGRVVEDALTTEGVSEIADLSDTASWPAVEVAADEYVVAFDSRTPGELKLESVRLTDKLGDVLGMALKAHRSTFSNRLADRADLDLGTDGIAWPAGLPRYKRPLLRWVAAHTRRAIDWRERFRFNRAQTFDLTRGLYDAVGSILATEGLIETHRDVYWLTEQEIDEIVNGHAWSLDAKNLVASRQAQFDGHAATEMSLAVSGAGAIPAHHLVAVQPAGTDGQLAGRGVAPGVLTAPVVVCAVFDPAVDVRDKILVVNHIDPGWTLLFTQAAGIVSERGNALSHAAIIAREIGIPAVVGVPGVLTALETGEIITIDGIRGSIHREKT